jgi:hypothetical protein
VTAPTKNLGCHSVFISSRSFALALCRSSSSVLRLVARENCRAVMASVTLDQKRRDSLGSWASVGGRILGATESGVRSIMGIWVSFFMLVSLGRKRNEEHLQILEQERNTESRANYLIFELRCPFLERPLSWSCCRLQDHIEI